MRDTFISRRGPEPMRKSVSDNDVRDAWSLSHPSPSYATSTPSSPGYIQAILLDEFQDTDPLQIEIAALRGVAGLPHRLQRADERVDVRLIGAQDVQEDVAQRSAFRRFCAKALLVEPLHEREEIRARPLEPAAISREGGRRERLQVLRPERLTREQTLGVVLRDPRLDRLLRVHLLPVSAEIAEVRASRLGCGPDGLGGCFGLNDAAKQIEDVSEGLLSLRTRFEVELVRRHLSLLMCLESARDGVGLCYCRSSRPQDREVRGLLAVERVPHRQLAHPVFEKQTDAVVLRRSALGESVRARGLRERSRRPMPSLHASWVVGYRGHLSVTSSGDLE